LQKQKESELMTYPWLNQLDVDRGWLSFKGPSHLHNLHIVYIYHLHIVYISHLYIVYSE